jgi:hypothetical protein
LRFGLGLFALALLGGLAQFVGSWIDVPFGVVLIVIGVLGLLLCVWLWRTMTADATGIFVSSSGFLTLTFFR